MKTAVMKRACPPDVHSRYDVISEKMHSTQTDSKHFDMIPSIFEERYTCCHKIDRGNANPKTEETDYYNFQRGVCSK
jgi:hypothetical protein